MFHKKQRELPHLILISIFFCILSVLLFFYAIENNIKWLTLVSLIIEDPVIFIISPLLLLYVKSLFSKDNGFIWKNKWHFLPLVIYFCGITIPVVYYVIKKQHLFSYLTWVDEHSYLIPFQILFLLIYAILSLRYLNKYDERIKGYYSNIDRRDISWIKNLMIGAIVVGLLDLSTTLYEAMFGILEWETGILTALSLVVLVMYLAYNGITQSQILIPSFELGRHPKDVEATSGNKSSVVQDDSLLARLNFALEKDKLYKDPEMTLSKLAGHVASSEKKVSATLNQNMKTSFYDLINRYRVEEVKQMMASDEFDHYTLLGIAFEAGFKSKTSFYRVFKKHTGMTPAQYKGLK